MTNRIATTIRISMYCSSKSQCNGSSRLWW